MTGRVYLDWNATAPLRPEARAAMVAACDLVGNPSSVHAEGRAARAAVERAREEVAALVGAKAREVVFTSGATEAARVLACGPAGAAVIVEGTAHDCLTAHAREGGDAGAVLAAGLANGETGVIGEMPVRGADGYAFGGKTAERLLLDVVQAAGRIPFAFGWSGAEMAIVSAHKIGGPKGVGALVVREGLEIATLQPGGGQETGRRSGTENVAGITGFGAAARAALAELDGGVWDGVARLRDAFEARIVAEAPGTVVVGRTGARLPNTSCLMTPGWKGETQVMQMDLQGFAISAGSACSSGKVRASRVLRAMGFGEVEAASAIRVSIGPATTQDELDRFADSWLAARARFAARAA